MLKENQLARRLDRFAGILSGFFQDSFRILSGFFQDSFGNLSGIFWDPIHDISADGFKTLVGIPEIPRVPGVSGFRPPEGFVKDSSGSWEIFHADPTAWNIARVLNL